MKIPINSATGKPRSFYSTKKRYVSMEMSEWVEKAPELFKLLKDGYSYDRIGKHFGGVSRQRVSQVISKLNSSYGFNLKPNRLSNP